MISGLTIQGGKVAASGGGIHNIGTLTLLNSVVRDNEATGNDGGAIYHNGAKLELSVDGD